MGDSKRYYLNEHTKKLLKGSSETRDTSILECAVKGWYVDYEPCHGPCVVYE